MYAVQQPKIFPKVMILDHCNEKEEWFITEACPTNWVGMCVDYNIVTFHFCFR